jgi:hypothetical protein
MIDKDKPIPRDIQLQAILDYQKAVNIYTSAPGAKYGGKDAAEITDQQRANAKATMDRLAAFLPANQRGTQPPAVDRTAIGVQPAATRDLPGGLTAPPPTYAGIPRDAVLLAYKNGQLTRLEAEEALKNIGG